MRYRKTFLPVAILFLAAAMTCRAQSPGSIARDSLSLQILDFPDSAYSCAPLTFRIAYNTTGRDMKVNATVGADPVDQTPRNFGDWVNGSGVLTYRYRVPNHQRASGFWCTAYLTPDGTWGGRELVVTTANRISKVTPVDWRVQWAFDVPLHASVDSAFRTTVRYACADPRSKSIPYLVVDLVAPDRRVIARQIEWSVPESAVYRQSWILPADANVSTLQIVARIEDETLSENQQPISRGDGPAFPVAGGRPPDFGNVAFHADTLYLKGSPSFLHGADIFSFWYTWPDSVARRELAKMRNAGLNYVRVFLDWSSYQNRAGQFNAGYKSKIATFLRAADSLGVWVELVPVGNWGDWVYDMYRDHWWTHPATRRANEAYFEEVGRFLDSLNTPNIFYVSMMQEGSWYFDWYDPYTGGDYPGAGALAEADADWAAWLTERGAAYRTFDGADAELFGRWSAERFADLLSLRAAAFRRGSRGRFAVGAEGTGGGVQYDRRLLGKHCTYYTLPELWAHTVDIIEVHNYAPNDFTGYWSPMTGFRTMRDWTRDFRKPVNVGEVNYTYCDNAIDMGGGAAWSRLREKLELIRSLGYTGYAVWAWMDYDQRKLGLLDLQYQPRPILDSLSRWIGVRPTGMGDERIASGFVLDQNYPNPVTEGSTLISFSLSSFIASRGPVRISILDLLGREVARVADREFGAGRQVIRCDVSSLPPGSYILRFQAKDLTARRSMVILR